MHNGLIKVVTGIRRSGKSYLLFKLFREHLLATGVLADHIIAIELDRLENETYRDPYKLLSRVKELISGTGRYYLLLDEVQLLSRFEEVLNSLLHEPDLDIYVTGSNSRFLSTDIITEFRGRGDEIHIFPLSFAEFSTAYHGDYYSAWAEYITFGGMPLTVSMRTAEEKSSYLHRLFTETYLRDIIARNNVKRTTELESLIDVLASTIGALTNPAKLEATFKSKLKSSISNHTIKQYLDYLADAFIIHPANRYDVKGRKYIGTPLKYYFEDVGLRNARLSFRQVEETHLMENVIYNELRLRGYNVDVGVVNKRFQDESGRRLSRALEIDFVANLGRHRYYIQSAYSLPTPEKLAQEKASLLALGDSFKKIIITKDIIRPTNDDNGILTIGLFDFLLDENSLKL